MKNNSLQNENRFVFSSFIIVTEVRHCEERSDPESIPILKIIGMKNKSLWY